VIYQSDSLDTRESIKLEDLAALFAKWPGPTLMAAGVLLACAATGIRVEGVTFSGRDFAGFEFAAVFLGGILLIAIGTAVLLVRDRLLVEDALQMRRQAHEQAIEQARAAALSGQNAEASFNAAYEAARNRSST